MEKEKKVIIIALVAMLVIVIGASYAFFTAGISSEDSTTIKADAGIMKITYDGGANIALSGIYPRNDAWATKVITVTGNNTADTQMHYKLKLVVDSNTFLNSDPLQYELVSTNTSNNGKIISAIAKTNLIDTTIELGEGAFNKANNARHTYQLKIYYPNKRTSQNSNQGKEFMAHVEIESVKPESTGSSENTWENPMDGTLLASIKHLNGVETPKYTPGVNASRSDEAILASTEDDYGTSYYFRGNVQNNYVQFANKCWRIVRILGDSNIKLTLYSDNNNLRENPCSDSNTISAPLDPLDPAFEDTEYDIKYGAFAQAGGTEGYISTKFNEKYDDNAYVGFKYGTAGSSDYDSTHENVNTSSISSQLMSWYDLYDYEDKIVETEWCADKSVASTSFDPWGRSPNGLGYAKNNTYYAAMERLISSNKTSGGTGPSLKCSGNYSKIKSRVGLLTADEIAFAGYAYSNNSSSAVYLDDNATGASWWTMTPASHISYMSSVFISDLSSLSVNQYAAIRPSISLASDVLSTGTGTFDDPYIIK